MGSYNYGNHLGSKDVLQNPLDPFRGKYKLAVAALQAPLLQRLVPADAITGGFRGNLQWEPGNKLPEGKISVSPRALGWVVLGNGWVQMGSPAQKPSS